MYTEQKGAQTFVINSVRKQKAITPASFLQVLSLVEIVAYHQDNREINRIKELKLEVPFKRIPFDRNQSAVVLCLAEILSKVIRSSYPDERLFGFLHNQIFLYDQAEEIDRDFLIRILTDLTAYLGFEFDYHTPCMDGYLFDLLGGQLIQKAGGTASAYLMSGEDFTALKRIMENPPFPPQPIPYEVRGRIVDHIVLYFQLHVESLKEVKSLPILRSLM